MKENRYFKLASGEMFEIKYSPEGYPTLDLPKESLVSYHNFVEWMLKNGDVKECDENGKEKVEVHDNFEFESSNNKGYRYVCVKVSDEMYKVIGLEHDFNRHVYIYRKEIVENNIRVGFWVKIKKCRCKTYT